ncbi:hypothetical protein [Pseudonocardia sp. HH130630-07]|uniref:hypothetical protein n=1 Tax=Pseudonocardia sp. HH130630-07 TaxID=1690815 RepID=UPI000814FF74|nr:hypothetical protein [Pseudonocardia sp. HH130630-07]ANY07271.1 hypothetical protein AFB00_14375 [Pseudonocardia sp. HH130630-07]
MTIDGAADLAPRSGPAADHRDGPADGITAVGLRPPGGPHVAAFDWNAPVAVVDGHSTGLQDLAVGGYVLPPYRYTPPIEHRRTDVIVHIRRCGPEKAVILYGDRLRYRAVADRGDLVAIPAGHRYLVANGSADEAVEFTACHSDRTLHDVHPVTDPAADAEDGFAAVVSQQLWRWDFAPGPVRVVSPHGVGATGVSPQGHRTLRPVIDGRHDGTTPGMRVCAGYLEVAPQFLARAHHHPGTDVIVEVLEAGPQGAVTLFGDELQHEARQLAGELLPLPRTVPHTVFNPSMFDRVVAVEYRSSQSVDHDNEVLAHLQPEAVRCAERLLAEDTDPALLEAYRRHRDPAEQGRLG